MLSSNAHNFGNVPEFQGASYSRPPPGHYSWTRTGAQDDPKMSHPREVRFAHQGDFLHCWVI